MKDFVKTSVYIFSHTISFLGRLFGFGAKRIYILMYHSVEESAWKYGVAPKDILKQLEYLRTYYTIVPLTDIVSYVKRGSDLKDKSIALTFDDGYMGVYNYVYPYAKKYNIPFTIFLTTDLSETEKMGNLKRLSWREVEDMATSGLVSIEAHGDKHENLTTLSKQDLEVLFSKTKEEIQKHTGKTPRFIAYPSGHKNEQVVDVTKKYFDAGFSITEGTIVPGDDVYTLKRVQVDRTMSFLQFKLRIGGGIDIHRKYIDMIRKFSF